MATAIHTTEFLINGEWVFYSEDEMEYDTYEALRRRQGNLDMPHITRVFKNGIMTEVRTIKWRGDTTIVRDTVVWP